MKKLLIIGALACAGVVFAQDSLYKARQPTAAEQRRIAGLSHYIEDGPRYGITYRTPDPDTIYTNRVTNSIVIFQSTAALTNVHFQMFDPTNQGRYAMQVVARGNITVTLTTSNLYAAAAAGPGFSTMTNVVANPYVMPTNSSALVVSTGTNYLVVPGAK